MCLVLLAGIFLFPVVSHAATVLYNPSCLDNYEDWPQSDTKNEDAAWSLGDIPLFPAGISDTWVFDDAMRQFIDLNGDGLLDFLYYLKYRESTHSLNNSYECVLLNNGQGWDIAYRCVGVWSSGNGFKYYGDCADTGQ